MSISHQRLDVEGLFGRGQLQVEVADILDRFIRRSLFEDPEEIRTKRRDSLTDAAASTAAAGDEEESEAKANRKLLGVADLCHQLLPPIT